MANFELETTEWSLATDKLIAKLYDYKPVYCPLVHRFTPGMYCREIFMPAGTLVGSYIHGTEHIYVVSQGCLTVWTEEEGEVLIEAPYTGITLPGTRRILYIHEDCIFTTFHPAHEQPADNSESEILKTVEAIMDRILIPHVNEYLEEVIALKQIENGVIQASANISE